MKHILATSLLVGYIILVPFCLFGGTLLAEHLHTAELATDPMHHVHDCEMPFSGCAHTTDAGALDTAVHHISMYLSITQTPLTTLSLIVAIFSLLFLFTLVVSIGWLRTFFAQTSYVRTRRIDERHFNIRQKILSWLSLFEASPNFA